MMAVARAVARTFGQTILAGLVMASLATRAWALCPNCLAQRTVLTPTLKLLGLFLLVPFAVAAIAIGVVRRALYGRAPSLPSAPPSSEGGDQGG
jgi:hypothetical protein